MSDPIAMPGEARLAAVARILRAHGPDCPSARVRERLGAGFGEADTALARLVEGGLATYRLGEPSPRHAGLRPRLYSLTGRGERLVAQGRA